MKPQPTVLQRRLIRAANVLTGFAFCCTLLGRTALAVLAGSVAAALALSVLRNLVRMGDR